MKHDPSDPRLAVLKLCVSVGKEEPLPEGWFLMHPENTENKELHWKCYCGVLEKDPHGIGIWVGPTDAQTTQFRDNIHGLDLSLQERIKALIVSLEKVLKEQKEPVVKKIILRILRNPPSLGAVFWLYKGGLGDFIGDWEIAV